MKEDRLCSECDYMLQHICPECGHPLQHEITEKYDALLCENSECNFGDVVSVQSAFKYSLRESYYMDVSSEFLI